MNYRVGLFGFSSLGESPNLGILDQRIAIQWVADNIASFGGNASMVMIC